MVSDVLVGRKEWAYWESLSSPSSSAEPYLDVAMLQQSPILLPDDRKAVESYTSLSVSSANLQSDMIKRHASRSRQRRTTSTGCINRGKRGDARH
jgi:hypothetical protein